jgi:hypothetical protein
MIRILFTMKMTLFPFNTGSSVSSPPAANRQPPTASRQPPAAHQILSISIKFQPEIPKYHSFRSIPHREINHSRIPENDIIINQIPIPKARTL